MRTIVNDITFDYANKNANEFFATHGWVVINDTIPPAIVSSSLNQWELLKKQCADDMKISLDEYEKEVSQWRDLWMNGGTFRELIHEPKLLHNRVSDTMGWRGIRLLHDHLICKPYQGSNRRIPWHQDSMFWPVSLPGCSSWTPLNNVEVNDGCLEVIDKSHLEGCESPVDFMAEERWDFPEESVRVLLPVKAGCTILLHSLTWHRSGPNKGKTNRPAHLALWIHPDAKWRPDLVDWHPVNEHVESEENQRLEGARFPNFGVIDNVDDPVEDIHSGTIRNAGISMFDASKIVGHQISNILEINGNITKLLSEMDNRIFVRNNLINEGICSLEQADDLDRILHRLWISHAAYSMHRARNVYNDAYAEWWSIAGESLDDRN
jgi:hypothetical protein